MRGASPAERKDDCDRRASLYMSKKALDNSAGAQRKFQPSNARYGRLRYWMSRVIQRKQLVAKSWARNKVWNNRGRG